MRLRAQYRTESRGDTGSKGATRGVMIAGRAWQWLSAHEHRRRMPHSGVLAVDVASLSARGPHVLVGATHCLCHTYAQPLKSRAKGELERALLGMLVHARRRG